MTHTKALMFLIVLLLQSTASLAAEVKLTGNYLEGKWSEQGKEGCTSVTANYVTFHNDHTLAAGQGDAVRAVGFWEPGDGTVILHLLVSPGTGTALHPFYQQRYYYQYMSPKILAMQPNSFDFTQDTGAGAGTIKTLTRCE